MTALLTNAVLAHQGGWDEILLVAAPILVFAGLLLVANRRAGAANGDNAETGETADSTKPTKSESSGSKKPKKSKK